MSAINGDFEPAARAHVSQGLKLNYFEWGEEGAPVLLLLHGVRDHARSWDWTARALGRGWRIIAPDLRGHGDSDWSRDGAYLGSYHVLDLADLIDALGCDQLSIVAHSLGGNIASRYAAAYPDRVRKLVLVEGLGPAISTLERWAAQGPVERTREWMNRRRAAIAGPPRRMATIAEATARMAAANPHLSPEQAAHLARHGVREHADGYGWKYDPQVFLFTPEDFSAGGGAVWREIACPVLSLTGSESWAGNPEADGRAAHLRDRRSLVFDNAGHWLHHDQFERFIAALREFL